MTFASLRSSFRLVVLLSVSLTTAAAGAQTFSPRVSYVTATVAPNWTQQSPATSPSPRRQSSMAYDAATGQTVLFGGFNSSSGYLGDTWTYNGTTWTPQNPALSPSARYLSAMAYDAATGQVVLFGGYGGGALGDTWTYNGTTWTQQSPALSPAARYDSTMAYDAATGQVVLFGGYGTSSSLSDTWTYNGTTWTQQSPASSPTARYLSTMAYDAATGQVVLFGGYNGSSTLGDTWTYNGTTWTQQSLPISPSARYDSTMAYDVATGQLVLFGGYGGVTLNDTLTYNGTTWTQQSPASSPSARNLPGMAYDAATGQVVLFGGFDGSSYLGDTWTYQLGAGGAPTSAVGTAAAQTPVYFLIGTGGTLPALSNTNVLTMGVSGLDFTLGSGSTCTGAVTSGQTCTVNVAFTPKYPGQRMGAVNLINSTSTVIATAYISGTGTGPLATMSPGLLSTVAGTGTQCSSSPATCGDGASATATGSNLFDPSGVAVDGAGNLYIADTNDNRIRKVTAATGILSTVAGTGTACSPSTAACGDGASATATGSNLSDPSGVAVDGAGNLYIADTNDNRIRKVTAATGILSTVAGTGAACSSPTAACGDGGSATATGSNFYSLAGVAVDGAGNLYIADEGDNRIRKVTAATGILSTVAGTGATCSPTTATCGDGASATATGANLNYPGGLAVDGAGNLYIADSTDHRIRKVTAATGILSTVAGTGTGCSPSTASCGDGASATATGSNLNTPTGVSVDGAGNLYIAELFDNRIRKVTAATGILSTVAGTGTNCYPTTASCGDGASATATGSNLYYPLGAGLDGAGNLYIADYGDNRIRKVSTTAGIVFPTTTPAGTADTTDGTQTVTLNNIGNASLTLTSQTESSSNFVSGNPMTGGCSTATAVVAGGSCLIGATFTPQTGQSGGLIGSVVTKDNSLNVAGSVQYTPLTGMTSAGAIVIAVNEVVTKAGTASVLMGFQYGYTAAPDTGAETITVNGSPTGVGTVSCTYKSSHASCSFMYTGSALATVNGNGYAISVSIAASGSYAPGSGTNLLFVNAATTQGGGHLGAPVSGFVATPVAGGSTKAIVPARGAAVAPAVARPVVVNGLPSIIMPADSTTDDSVETKCVGTDCKVTEK